MKCPACPQDNPDGARFCNGCGTRLTAASPAGAPQAYTPQRRQRFDELTEERRREQLDHDLRDCGFGVAPRRHG
jgi:double zinc ribbon protein